MLQSAANLPINDCGGNRTVRGELMADWQAMKTEYITTDTSYRKLAQKYGINVTTIAKTAGADGWVEQRKQYATETQAKTLEIISQKEADRAARIHTVADKLLNKIEAMVDSGMPLDTKGVRALTAAVKNLAEVQGVRSALDEQEQRARIANLQKQADKDEDKTDEIEVVFAGGEEAWHG